MSRIFYQVVTSDPPTRQDFFSHEALGVPLRNEDARNLWQGICVQATEQQARQRAKLPGFGRYIAQMENPESESIRWQRTGRQAGRQTLWGDPDDLFDCVIRTIPVEEG